MADGLFEFETNIEAILGRIREGVAEIDRVAGGRGTAKNQFVQDVTTAIDAKVVAASRQLDQLTTAFGRGQNTGKSTFAQQFTGGIRDFGRQLDAEMRTVFKNAPKSLSAADLAAVQKAALDRAYAAFGQQYRASRGALRLEGVDAGQIGGRVRFNDIRRDTSSLNERVISEQVRPSAATRARLDAVAKQEERAREDLARAEVDAAQAARHMAVGMETVGRRAARLERNIANQNEQLVGRLIPIKEGQREVRGAPALSAVGNPYDPSVVYTNRITGAPLTQEQTNIARKRETDALEKDAAAIEQLVEADKRAVQVALLDLERRAKRANDLVTNKGVTELNGQLYNRSTAAQITDPQDLSRIRQREVDAETRRAKAAADLTAADEKLLQVALLELERRSGRARDLSTARGVTRLDGGLYNTRSGAEITNPQDIARIEEREKAVAARRLATTEKEAEAEQRALGETLAAMQDRAAFERLMAARAAGQLRQLNARSFENTTTGEISRVTGVNRATTNLGDSERANLSEKSRRLQEQEVVAQGKLNDAIDKRAQDAARQGIKNSFLSGLNARGFGGGGGTFSGSFSGLAYKAGNTAAYAAAGSALFGLIGTLQQAEQEYLNFVDSNTELTIALDGTGHASTDMVNALQTVAATAGANVGDAMDQAASGIRAFKDDTDGSKESLEQLGVAFDTQAARIAVVAKTTLADAAANLKAATLAFDLPGTEAGFSRITDVTVGAKNITGGDEKQISQALASGGAAAAQAQFSPEQFALLAGKVQAQTDQSGQAIAQSFSRAFTIIGGNEGKNAITRLNASLADTAKIDIKSPIETQFRQLSAVFDQLSDAQQQTLINSLGGTANPRALIVALKNANELLSDASVAQIKAGGGAEEYNTRLKDLTKTLLDIKGQFSGIAVNLGRSGVFAPLGLAVDAFDKMLQVVNGVLGAINQLPSSLRTAVGFAVALYGAFRLIRGVNAAGGVKGFVGNVERAVLPGQALARSSLRRESQAVQDRTALSSRGPIQTPESVRARTANAAVTRSEADLARARAASERATLASAARVNAADVANRSTTTVVPGNVRAANLAAAEANHVKVVQEAAAAEAKAYSSHVAVINAATLADAEAASKQVAVDQAQAAYDQRETQLRAQRNISIQQANAAFERDEITTRELRSRENAAKQLYVTELTEANVRLAGAITGTGIIPPRGGPAAPGSRTGYTAARDAARAGASRADAAAAAGGTAAARFGAKVGETSVLRAVGSTALSAIGGGLGLGLIGGYAAYSTYQKNAAINKANNAGVDAQAEKVDVSSSTSILDAAKNLRSGAAETREAQKGFLTGIVSFYKGDPLNRTANNEDAQASYLENAAKELDAVTKAAISRTASAGATSAFDLASGGPDAAAEGIERLQAQGLGARDAAQGLAAAISLLTQNAINATTTLGDVDLEKATIAFNQAFTRSFRKSADGLPTVGQLADGALGRGDRNAANNTGILAQQRKKAKDLLQNADLSPLGDQLDRITRDTLKGKDASDPKVRRELADAQTKAVNEYLDSINYPDNPELRKAALSSVSEAVGALNQFGGKSKTADQVKQAVIDYQKTAIEQAASVGQAVELDNSGVVDQPGGPSILQSAISNGLGRFGRQGDALAGARAQLDYLQGVKDDMVAALKAKGLSEGEINAATGQISDAIQAASQTVDQQTVARLDTLNKFAQNLPAIIRNGRRVGGGFATTDTLGRLDADIATNRNQQKNASGDDLEVLEDEANQQQARRAQLVVQIANAQRDAARDPRDSQGTAIDAMKDAQAVLKQVIASGDTSSDTYLNDLATFRKTRIDANNAIIDEANSVRSGRVAVGDDVGEARAAARNARDAIGKVVKYIQDPKTGKMVLSGQYLNAVRDADQANYDYLQKRDARSNAQTLAGLDSRDTVADDRQAARYLRRQLNDTPAGDVTKRAELQRQIQEADRKTLEDRVARTNANSLARIDPRNATRLARANLRGAERNLALQLPGTAEYADALQAVNQAKLDVAKANAEKANARDAASVDSRNTTGVARSSLRQAQRNLSLQLYGTAEYYQALQAVNEAKLAVAKANIELADARDASNVFAGSDLQSARATLVAAQRAMTDDLVGSLEYYQDLASLHQAQQQYADAVRQAASDARRTTIDLTDPVATAQADLTDAMAKLAQDTAAGAPADVLNRDKIDVTNASNALEAAQFDANLNKWDVADRLGRITHQAHMAYLQGEHDRLSAITNRTYQQQQELDQVDLALQDITDNINSAVSGQFNLGDIKVPTVYEVRRSMGILNGTGGSAGGNDNSQNNTTVYINGADFGAVVNYLNQVLGQQAQVTRTTTGARK